MSERFFYYLQLISEACGYNGSEGNSVIGWLIVTFSVGLVIASYYYCISLSIWPGEESNDHIKRRILLESEAYDEN
jgi:hypothetical protein